MVPVSTVLLFVYGSLRRNARRRETQQAPYDLLAHHSRFLSEATVQAKLYDLGEYTGMLYPERGQVIGDVFAIDPSQWSAVIARLDEYEGCTENDPEPLEYRRDLVQAQLSGG